MISKTAKVYADIVASRNQLLNGLVVCIDPSIGSSSSQPGWAVYNKQQLVTYGSIYINPGRSIPTRLQELRGWMYNLYKDYPPDVLVYEDIPPQVHGKGNATSHSSLLKAVGVILSIAGPTAFVGIMPISWKRLARPDYVKSDANDAKEIGYVVIKTAQEMEVSNDRRTKTTTSVRTDTR